MNDFAGSLTGTRCMTRAAFPAPHPLRIQAWREVNELPGRTLMRGGARIT